MASAAPSYLEQVLREPHSPVDRWRAGPRRRLFAKSIETRSGIGDIGKAAASPPRRPGMRVTLVGEAEGAPKTLSFIGNSLGIHTQSREARAPRASLWVLPPYSLARTRAPGRVAADAAGAIVTANAAAGVQAGGARLVGLAGGRAALDTKTRRCLAGYASAVGPAGATNPAVAADAAVADADAAISAVAPAARAV